MVQHLVLVRGGQLEVPIQVHQLLVGQPMQEAQMIVEMVVLRMKDEADERWKWRTRWNCG